MIQHDKTPFQIIQCVHKFYVLKLSGILESKSVTSSYKSKSEKFKSDMLQMLSEND